MIEARFHLTVLVLSTLYLPIVAAPLAAQSTSQRTRGCFLRRRMAMRNGCRRRVTI
jgi:hypothetical protein